MHTHFATVPVELARQKTAADGSDRPSPLVLVVDDEPLIAETLAAILSNCGLAAITAPDGEAALEIAALIPPEILITDISMPGMSGIDLALEVTRKVSDCEVILFSGLTSSSGMVVSEGSVGRDFVTMMKPVHPADLLARVYECLSKVGLSVPRKEVSTGNPYTVLSSVGVDDDTRTHAGELQAQTE